MTEICSKSDAKFTDGLAGLSNKKGSEDGIGLFDSLFGIISEEKIKLEPEITLLPSDIKLPDQNKVVKTKTKYAIGLELSLT